MTDDIAKLRREVAELRSWVWEVNDILSSASVSVHLREDQPWDSFLFQSHIGGEQRARILLAIEAVLHRAKTGGAYQLDARRQELLDKCPALAEILQNGPIDRAEAETLIGKAADREYLGARALQAHRAQGLDPAGHEALGD